MDDGMSFRSRLRTEDKDGGGLRATRHTKLLDRRSASVRALERKRERVRKSESVREKGMVVEKI